MPRSPVTVLLGMVAGGLVACTTIDKSVPPPEDWPDLAVVEYYLDYTALQNKCGASPLIILWACMIPDFDRKECNLYFRKDDVPKWVREHEMEHCRGYDHPGETTLKDWWAAWKRQKGTT